jgi:hypothetical protein
MIDSYPESAVKIMQDVFNQALGKMGTLGALVCDPADLSCGKVDVSAVAERIIKHELRESFDAYLCKVKNGKVKNLRELVRQVAFHTVGNVLWSTILMRRTDDQVQR